MPDRRSARARRRRTPRLPVSHRRSWERTYAQTGFRDLPWYSPRPSPWLVAAVQKGWLSRGGDVLDVGCGAGSNVLWLARHGFRATGVDIAPSAIAAAEARARSTGVNGSFRVADVLDLPFPRGSFSSALDSGCFHTIPIRLRGAYVAELARILRRGGALILTWVAREETRAMGPSHRPSLAEVATAFEPRFIVASSEFHAGRARTAWSVPGGSLARYTARLVRRQGRQPPPR